ncbi:MAG: prepilin-type N-terminal cleavage/methylation domain-containing protein [Planctomycetota bacterium]|nr:MAG: prepilin-type N-terminal cleavage/methylation domain-containing protein [Planctomycetota bacterium]
MPMLAAIWMPMNHGPNLPPKWPESCLMNTKRPCTKRRGVTLLELVVASSMLAVVMTSLTLVLRTTRASWETNDNDFAAIHHAHTVVRHFVRQAREATDLLALTGNSVQLKFRDGSTQTWSHTANGNGYTNVVQVVYSNSSQVVPLAYGIKNLSFRGFKADGVTPTTVLDDIYVVEVTATVLIPGKANAPQSVASKAWIRSW